MKNGIITEDCFSYLRPSVNARTVREFFRMDTIELYIGESEGFYELRPTNEKGVMFTEFIEAKNVMLLADEA